LPKIFELIICKNGKYIYRISERNRKYRGGEFDCSKKIELSKERWHF
jgi:hypothetical protein